MYTVIVCLAATAVGIDYGWQRMPDGDMQYIIQLDPQTLDALRDGRAIESDIPPLAGNVRSYRIVVGHKSLPHDTSPAPSPPASLPALPPEAAKPLPEHRAVYMEPKTPAAPPPSPADVTAEAEKPEKPEKPWLPLTFALLGLFASMGGNLYLGWVAWDARRFREQEAMGKSIRL